MIIVLLDRENDRIRYAFDFIFRERDVSYEITCDPDYFRSDTPGFRLNYSSKHLDCSFELQPASIMNESGFRKQEIKDGEYKGIKCLSFDGHPDPIASLFYVLTRYEEYDPEYRDEHGRFPYSKSCLKKFKWIDQAICDRWARALIELLDRDIFMESVLRSKLTSQVAIVPTFDIDNAYAYLHKKGFRRFFSILKDLLRGDWKRLKERKVVETGQQKDPYDTYQDIKDIAKRFPTTRMFWLYSKRGKKDRNLNPDSVGFRQLIQEMSTQTKTGLHPSYGSFGISAEIKIQKEALEKVIQQKVESTRQHYLRTSLPDTYRALIEVGFTDDYTMGFAEHIGFRCGTARTHKWFDVLKNEKSNLAIHPFVYMDGSLNEYMHLSPEKAKEYILELYKEVNEYGGDFTFIWHNETIGGYGKWKDWRDVLDFSLNL